MFGIIIMMVIVLYDWEHEYTPTRWRKVVVMNVFRKGGKEQCP